jgi:hypothetical protein
MIHNSYLYGFVRRGSMVPLTLLALVLPWSAHAQEPGDGAFLYRGSLNENGLPSNGQYDLLFRLADSLENGNYLGNTQTNLATAVTNGQFAVRLDFGAAWFDGSRRWIEIAVRSNGLAVPFTLLNPRQEILAVPYSLHAASSANAILAKGLIDGGASLTNLPARFLAGFVPPARLAGIGPAQMDPATDNLYRSGSSNRVTVINVRDFGAVGDGVTDDTVAISNAWGRFMANGGTLYFPPGVYLDSGTHSNSANAPGRFDLIDGRLVLGGASVRWHYSGHGQLFNIQSSSPDFDGFEFSCSSDATNCMYISRPGGNVNIRNCFFNGWTNASLGALMIDEADSPNLVNVYAFRCKVGVGLGFRCNHLVADLETYLCDVGVAIGIPTPTFPIARQSYDVDLNIMSLYCSNAVAIDAGATGITVRGYFWNCTNAPVTIGMIPGVSTNYLGSAAHSVTLNHCYFQGGDAYGSAIQLYGPILRALNVVDCWFDQTLQSKPLIKSFSPAADLPPIHWVSSFRNGPRPEFEDSIGNRLTENALLQNRELNQGLGLYNVRNQAQLGGSGFLLDVLDASFAGPIARLGVPSRPDWTFDSFRGGLTVSYDASQSIPRVTVTNAELVVSSPCAVLASTSPGIPGSIRWDTNYLYICVQTNLWKRAPLSTW